ncbi:MAG: UV DNA damage repair endonuclease UvsE [Clostridia bacterium]
MKSVRLANASCASLENATLHNLTVLDRMMEYNLSNDIRLFRMSSDIIPLASHPSVSFDWFGKFRNIFDAIGEKTRNGNIRVSMHPGQYTVLNAENTDVVSRSLADIEYHHLFLHALGLGVSHKIVIHIGGVYGDKKSAMKRFVHNLEFLSEGALDRLVIENDELRFNVEDVLEINRETQLPVVFDVFHHALNPGPSGKPLLEILDACRRTWGHRDGIQKIHYSQQGSGRRGSHSTSIRLEGFLDFYRSLPNEPIDIMLEVKDKNLSALKCIHATDPGIRKNTLEKQWARYKYLTMSQSYARYKDISALFRQNINPADLAVSFYTSLEKTLSLQQDQGNQANTLLHIWGHLKEKATKKESEAFQSRFEKFMANTLSLSAVNRYLYGLALAYEEEYLIQSHYFHFNGGINGA